MANNFRVEKLRKVLESLEFLESMNEDTKREYEAKTGESSKQLVEYFEGRADGFRSAVKYIKKEFDLDA
jgi:hypothetical protein